MKNPSSLHYEMPIPAEYAGFRLDQALAALLPMHSRSRLQAWIKQKQVLIDGSAAWRAKDKLQGGEHLMITATAEENTTWSAQAMDLAIIAEDDAILVINKPIGVVVHPAAGNYQGTLANALLHHYPFLTQVPRVGIVHRLDKDTSGLLVVAKTLAAHTALVEQLQKHEVQREYYAIVNSVLISGATVNLPIGRHPTQRQKMAVVNVGGKSAVTHYRVIERFQSHTLIKVLLETGRTHQIRVHMSHVGYPLVGDSLYGDRAKLPPKASPGLIQAIRQFKHQALHAKKLSFIHPDTKALVTFEAPLPQDMQNLILLLRENSNNLQ